MKRTHDTRQETRNRVLATTAGAAGICALIVLGTSTQNYVQYTMRLEEQVDFWRVMHWPAKWWSGWVILTPVVFELAWRRPVRPPKRLRHLALLALGCVAASLLHDAYQVAWMYAPGYTSPHDGLWDTVEYHIISSLYLNFFNYWAVVGVAHATKAYQRDHRRAIDSARLETELATARLDVLRMQLHPHFLFNTLNGIAALMYRDPACAEEMISRLSRLLRRALDRSDVHEVTLREEMEFLEEYLAIEQMRFADGLVVEVDVAGELDEVLVPTFVFQPIVENSIKHAVVPQGNQGRIAIRARAAAPRLILEVADDGPGLDQEVDSLGSGVGLPNLIGRLDRLYRDDYRIHLDDAAGPGLTVRLDLPLRYSPRA